MRKVRHEEAKRSVGPGGSKGDKGTDWAKRHLPCLVKRFSSFILRIRIRGLKLLMLFTTGKGCARKRSGENDAERLSQGS